MTKKSKPITFGDPELDTSVPIFIKGDKHADGAILHQWGDRRWYVHIATRRAVEPLFSLHLNEFKTLDEAKSAIRAAWAAHEGGEP